MLIEIYYQIILVLCDYVLLSVFKHGDRVLDVFDMDENILECRSDEDFILYDRHELWVDLVMIHVEFPC